MIPYFDPIQDVDQCSGNVRLIEFALDEKVLDAQFHYFYCKLDVLGGTDHDNRNFLFQLAQAKTEIQSIHIRKDEIGHDDVVGRIFTDGTKRLVRAGLVRYIEVDAPCLEPPRKQSKYFLVCGT